MAKTLKQILDGVKSSKLKTKDILGNQPGVDYSPKAGDERKFADKHKIEVHADRVGNGDDVYNATGIKQDTTARHGHKSRDDEKVYESAAKCNNTGAGKKCDVHGMKACTPGQMKEGFVFRDKWTSGDRKKRAEFHHDPTSGDVKVTHHEEGKHVSSADKTFSNSSDAMKHIKKYIGEEFGVDLSESRKVDSKSVISPRGGEDRYEMHHVGSGKGWHSIVKTHQDGQQLPFHNVVHVGNEKYVQKMWKGIKHATVKAAGPHKMDEEKLDELLVQSYASGAKNKMAEVHKNMNAGTYTVKKMIGSKIVGTKEHDDSGAAHDDAKKHIKEEDLAEKAAVAKGKQTVLVTMKGDSKAKSGGGVKRIKKSEYNPKIHALAEDQEQIDELSKKTLKGYVKSAHDDLRATSMQRNRSRMMSTKPGDKWDDETKYLDKHANKRAKGVMKALDKLGEEKMTDKQMAKREDIVNGMKKKLSDFRARYGSKAKNVMYATATKNAMKEENDNS